MSAFNTLGLNLPRLNGGPGGPNIGAIQQPFVGPQQGVPQLNQFGTGQVQQGGPLGGINPQGQNFQTALGNGNVSGMISAAAAIQPSAPQGQSFQTALDQVNINEIIAAAAANQPDY